MNNSEHVASNFSLLMPAFTAGLKDGINPCSLASVLIYIIFLSVIGTTEKRVFLFGGLFILSSLWVHFTIVLGVWDAIITNAAFLHWIRIVYLILAIFFILIGVIDIMDWRRHKKSGDVQNFRLNLPAFFREQNERRNDSLKMKILASIMSILLTVLIAGIVALMGTIYPQNEYIFIVHSYLMSGGNQGFAYQSFFLYSMAMILLLIIAFLKISWLAFKKGRSTRAVLYYKLVLSALFLSTGFGLGFYLLIN